MVVRLAVGLFVGVRRFRTYWPARLWLEVVPATEPDRGISSIFILSIHYTGKTEGQQAINDTQTTLYLMQNATPSKGVDRPRSTRKIGNLRPRSRGAGAWATGGAGASAEALVSRALALRRRSRARQPELTSGGECDGLRGWA